MAQNNIERASALLQGIGERNVNLATKYVNADRFKEHNPHVADGVQGLTEYINRLPHENHLKIVRAFDDGPYVFTQADGEILDQNTFFDVFRFEDGLIVEHWVFFCQSSSPQQERAHSNRWTH